MVVKEYIETPVAGQCDVLVKAGVEILYGTYAVAVSKKNDKIDAVIVENKTGR